MFYNLDQRFSLSLTQSVFAAFYPVFRFYIVTGHQLTAGGGEGGGSRTHSQIEENIKHSFCRVVLPFLTATPTKLLRSNAND